MRVTRWLRRKLTWRLWVRGSCQSSWIILEFVDHVRVNACNTMIASQVYMSPVSSWLLSEFVDHFRVRGSCWSSWIALEFVDHVRVGDSFDRNESWMHEILWLLRAFACCRWVRERIESCPILNESYSSYEWIMEMCDTQIASLPVASEFVREISHVPYVNESCPTSMNECSWVVSQKQKK